LPATLLLLIEEVVVVEGRVNPVVPLARRRVANAIVLLLMLRRWNIIMVSKNNIIVFGKDSDFEIIRGDSSREHRFDC
jgi:hypothetical protein